MRSTKSDSAAVAMNDSWTRGEMAALRRAVSAAPSVHNTQPWALEFQRHQVSLLERADRALPRHDPTGRDRLISCGAAVANLELTVRVLGWEPQLELFPHPSRPDEVARVTVRRRHIPSDIDLARYSAIPHRHSYRAPFGPERLPQAQVDELVAAVDDRVAVHRVSGPTEETAIAGLLCYAAVAIRNDQAYQRELTAWTAHGGSVRPGEGVPPGSARNASLPWAGLVRADTHLPDSDTLASRLASETLLVVQTADDARHDHVHAGMSVQRIWLAATQAKLVASVLTQPLHLPEVRAGLIERLELPGFPQALIRLGHPADSPRSSATPIPRTPNKGG